MNRPPVLAAAAGALLPAASARAAEVSLDYAGGEADQWVVADDGEVLRNAAREASLPRGAGDPPVVGIDVLPSGDGYWLAAADGGVFTFGRAAFFGSLGGTRLNAPIVDIEATPSGRGYWLVAADGGVFAFDDAPFLGSLGGRPLQGRVTGFAANDDGAGYWLAGEDGGRGAGAAVRGPVMRACSSPTEAVRFGPVR